VPGWREFPLSTRNSWDKPSRSPPLSAAALDLEAITIHEHRSSKSVFAT
jgi:hypothetical protein